MKTIAILVLIILCGTVGAEPTFLSVFGGSGNDISHNLAEVDNGDIIIGGRSNSYGEGNYDMYFSRYDTLGTNYWQKTLGTTSSERIESISKTSDGGFIITGYTDSPGNDDVIIAKFDILGNIVWKKRYGETGDEVGESVIEASAGKYLITGYTDSVGSGYDDAFIMEINDSGNVQWARAYGGTDWESGAEGSFEIIKTQNNNSLMVGETQSYGQGFRDILLLKVNQTGELLWDAVIGGTSSDWGNSVYETEDNSILISGYTQSSGNGYRDAYALKLDSNANKLWAKTIGGSDQDYGYSIIEADNSYYMLGYTQSYGSGSTNILLSRLNQSGEAYWTKSWSGGVYDYGNKLIPTTSGFLMFSGFTGSFGNGVQDFMLSRFNSSGETAGDNMTISDILTSWQDWDTDFTIEKNVGVNITDWTSIQTYDWSLGVLTRYGHNATTVSMDTALPLLTDFTENPRTTNFNAIENLSEVENLTLGTSYGSISFGNHSVDAEGQDYDSNVIFGDCFVAVNSTNLDYTFNATAYLMMNNSDGHCGDNTIFTTSDVVADAGVIKTTGEKCKECKELMSSGDLVNYKVPHFSSYAIGSNSNMTIDANDPKQVNQTVTFTAVYRNSSDGSFISGATCDIGLPNGTVTVMAEGTEEYTYQSSFTSNGTYTYNVTCSATGYHTLNTNDEFEIISEGEAVPEFNTMVIFCLLMGIILFIFYQRNSQNH